MKLTQIVGAMSGKIAKRLKPIGRPGCTLGDRPAHAQRDAAPGSREAVLVPAVGARITTVRGVYLIIALFVAIIIFFVVLIQLQMDTLNAIRFYVGGEGLWAKAQKDAVHRIEHYAISRDEADYQAYQRLIQVPLGNRRARIELQKENPDIAVVLAGFVQGGNHPEDIESAVRFFRRFQHTAYMSHAIGHWTTGDRMIAELNGVVEALHEELASGRNKPEIIRSYVARLEDINRQVAVEEGLFSSTLAEASRWANNVSRKITYAIAILFTIAGIALSWPIITRIRNTENALFESRERFRSIFEHVDDIIFTSESDGLFSSVSQSSERMLGWSPGELISRPFQLIVHPDDRPFMQELFMKAQAGERTPVFQVRILTKAGDYLESEIAVSLVHRGGSIVIVGVLRDITERKRIEQQLNASLAEKEVLVQSLHELAAHDGLTGLYNHREFYKLLEGELVRAQRFNSPVSLLLLDIDHFKRVNDTYGHLAGDAVLKELSELLGHQARAIDRVCRYGGEEITVILPESDLAAAANMAERMRAAVEAQPFDVEAGASVSITVSIGVASWPAHADNAKTLVAAADAALYAAKQGGRNRISRYEPALGQPAAQGP